MCIETLRTGLFFLRWSIWGVTCLALLNKCKISHLSSEKPNKHVLKCSEQGSFFWDDQFEGHMPRFTLKIEWFPIYLYPYKSYKCVL